MRYLLPRRVTMNRPAADLDKLFEDLSKFRDYCRFNGKVFDESHLYKNSSEIWRSYQHFLKHGPFKPRKNNRNNTRRPNTSYSKSRST
jgi:hypothetical protein